MRKKILFISAGPLGSLTDSLEYCKILKHKYEITYLGINGVGAIDKLEEINIIHLVDKKSKIKNIITLVKEYYKIRKKNFDNIFVIYFLGCSIFGILTRNNVVDLRSGTIKKNIVVRYIFDVLMRIECIFFKKITIISHGLAKKLKIKKYIELPLTSDPKICRLDLSHEKNITFLYIGTFHLREIEKTIKAFQLFLNIANKKYDDIIFSYIIIGPIKQFKDNNYQSLITELGLDENIKYEGEIRGDNLEKYLVKSSIGVSFIPCEPYFDYQPPTKTYEYLSWGLPVLATNTHSNKQIINKSNGVIHKTDIDSISNAMIDIVDKILNSNYDNKDLSINNKTWKNIIDNTLTEIL